MVSILDSKAKVLSDQGKFKESLDLYEKVLKSWEILLGLKHPDTAITYEGLAILHERMGEYAKALKFYDMTFVIREEMLGADHPYTIFTRNSRDRVIANMA